MFKMLRLGVGLRLRFVKRFILTVCLVYCLSHGGHFVNTPKHFWVLSTQIQGYSGRLNIASHALTGLFVSLFACLMEFTTCLTPI